ncbi:hypothetical protein B5S33_g2632 [[Candida] boidinii]|nr:hypothetical protein B5S33_g2632 [[Candida] boidinii]
MSNTNESTPLIPGGRRRQSTAINLDLYDTSSSYLNLPSLNNQQQQRQQQQHNHGNNTSSVPYRRVPEKYGSITNNNTATKQKHNQSKQHKSSCQYDSQKKQIQPILKTELKPEKLGTIGGVFIPTVLNVLSILMFLRFGFIIGQMGILGTLLLLFLSYGIDLLTTLSVSAIATNGTVRGGGAYYMISRSLGVEFGGSIGLIFYIGQVLNSSLNVAGFIEPLLFNFNEEDGAMNQILPIGYWWQLLYCTIFLLACTCVSLIGSSTVSKTGSFLTIILITATLSVPISAIFVKPFDVPELNTHYTGLSYKTFKENLLPHFTKGAAGSQRKAVETFNDLFGIFFPATAGIFAGASMSGDLQNPSKSIPKGTLWGLLLTFTCYALVIVSMGASIPRDFLHKDVQVIQTVNLSTVLVLLGEASTSLFSVIVGIVGAAKVLQAIARDEILPGLKLFAIGDKKSDDPIYGILFTWLLTQLFLFADINQIATFITMAFLMTFIVTNLACFLLKLGSAPNFRPSFKYFSNKTALLGTILSGIAMIIVDGISAILIFLILIFLILFIHYISPPKQWGDVSQSLIYHQVRKYLLKLRQDNVKYWRPQVLLLVDNPRTSWKLMHFCNHLKKGGLYVLGHVLTTTTFQDRIHELQKQKNAWVKLRDLSNIKAFIQVAVAPSFTWGVRDVFLGSGLGGMRPNICVIGFYDLSNFQKRNNSLYSPINSGGSMHSHRDSEMKNIDLNNNNISGNNSSSPSNTKVKFKLNPKTKIESNHPNFYSQVNIDMKNLPTDSCSIEPKVKFTEWVQIIEDLSLLGSNVAIAKGFPRLHIPSKDEPSLSESEKYLIDLYPIQMSAEVTDDYGKKSALTTNFDTYTLILQLGAILNTVPQWKRTHKLRVVVFVEYAQDVEDEKVRVKSLLEILRINAEVLVLCLNCGDFQTYNYISKGDTKVDDEIREHVDLCLKEDPWWSALKEFRDDIKKSTSSNVSIPVPSAAKDIKGSTFKTPRSRIASTYAGFGAYGSGSGSRGGSNSGGNVNGGGFGGLSFDIKNIPLPKESSNIASSKVMKNFERSHNRRYTISNMNKLGVSLSMMTNRILHSDIKRTITGGESDSDEEDSDSYTDTDSVISYSSTTSSQVQNNNNNNNNSGPASRQQSSQHLNQTFDQGVSASQIQASPQIQELQQQQQHPQNSMSPKIKPQLAKYPSSASHLRTAQFIHSQTSLQLPQQSSSLSLPDNANDNSNTTANANTNTNNNGTNNNTVSTNEDIHRISSNSHLPLPPIRKSSRKIQRSAFSADTMPKSQVIEDALGDQPSILFVKDADNDNETHSTHGKSSRAPSVKAGVSNNKKDDYSIVGTTSNDSNSVHNSTNSSRRQSVDFAGFNTLNDQNDESSTYDYARAGSNAAEDDLYDDLIFSFNEMTTRAQYLILNELMTSVSKDSKLLFSSLPIPDIGTHKSEEDSLNYIRDLDLWCCDLPPILLINSKTMTVTTAL